MTYTLTDDASDPCAYCVSWAERGEYAYGPEDFEPVDFDGTPIERLYRNIHPRCDQMVAAYCADHSLD